MTSCGITGKMVSGTKLTSAGIIIIIIIIIIIYYFISLAGVLSLLDEPEKDIQVFALSRLNELVDEFWPEISDALVKM